MIVLPESITEDDLATVEELFISAGPYVTARGPSDYWLYARLFGQTCLCVRIDGSAVAVVIAFRDQTPGVNEIYIQDVAVHPDYRGRGLAKLLLEELHRRACLWGVERVWLTSEADNTPAMKLWLRLGYVNIEADYDQDGVWLTENLKGPGRDRAVYELSLQTQLAS